jgi:hypothetical protein
LAKPDSPGFINSEADFNCGPSVGATIPTPYPRGALFSSLQGTPTISAPPESMTRFMMNNAFISLETPCFEHLL